MRDALSRKASASGGPIVRLSSHATGGFRARRQYQGSIPVRGGNGIATGAASTRPDTRSGWSSASAKASAPAQECPSTIAGPMPIRSSPCAMARAWTVGAAASGPKRRSLQPKPGLSKAITRNPLCASSRPTPSIGSEALPEAP